MAELQDLQQAKASQEQLLLKAARAERCLHLRQQIQSLKNQIQAVQSQRAAAVPPTQVPPPVAQPQVPPADEWEDLDWDLESRPQTSAAMGKALSQPPARTPRSGLVAKATDVVRFPQTWPHVALQDDFSNQSLEFNDLDFRLFVAGELEIATSSDIQECERAGRLRLLKQLAYLHGAHQWEIIRKIYIAVVRKIELGSLHWGSCFLNDIQWILTKHTITHHPRTRQPAPSARPQSSVPLYCIAFNRGKCTFKEAHYTQIRGKQEWVLHICSKCLRLSNQQNPHSQMDCSQ